MKVFQNSKNLQMRRPNKYSTHFNVEIKTENEHLKCEFELLVNNKAESSLPPVVGIFTFLCFCLDFF